MYKKYITSTGFTIVELLIVIVVIGILASITVVAYNGVQNRANDVALQSDVRNMGSQTLVTYPEGPYPNTEAGISTLEWHASRNSYGNHLVSGGMSYNALYCSTVTGYSPSAFAIISRSKSGNVYMFKDGQVTSPAASTWTSGWGVMCPAALGVAAGNSANGIWLYENSIWKIWLK